MRGRRSRRVAVLFLLIAVATQVHAQEAGESMSLVAIQHAKVGAFAEYTAKIPGMDKPTKITYALTSRTADGVVFELDTQTPDGLILMRLTCAKKGDRYLVRRAEVKKENAPAEVENVTDEQPLGGALGKPLGKARVTTPVGTFNCRKYLTKGKQADVESFLADDVMPIGLVKKTSADGFAMELTKTGDNYRSRF